MNPHPRILACVAGALTVACSLSAAADDPAPGDAVARCASIASSQQRLACYDAAAGRQAPVGVKAAPPATAAPVAAATATATATAPAAASPDAKFGLKESAPKQDPVSLSARVVALVENTQGKVIITLDNNQKWEFQGPDSALGVGDEVTITTAALGSFLMTTPARHKLRVRRLS